MVRTLYESCLPLNWQKRALEESNFDIAPEHMDKILYVLFASTAQLLKATATKDKAAAFMFQKFNGDFIAAGICEFTENADPKLPGNYSLSWTFDESDIPEDAIRLNFQNSECVNFANGVSASSPYSFTFSSPTSLNVLANLTMSSIYKWLDENAKEDEEVGIDVDGICSARVVVENGIKVFALTPAGEIKAMVKKDGNIEK